jgi:hypothetical protein
MLKPFVLVGLNFYLISFLKIRFFINFKTCSKQTAYKIKDYNIWIKEYAVEKGSQIADTNKLDIMQITLKRIQIKLILY